MREFTETNEIGVVHPPESDFGVLLTTNKKHKNIFMNSILLGAINIYSDLLRNESEPFLNFAKAFFELTGENVEKIKVYERSYENLYNSTIEFTSRTYERVPPYISFIFGIIGDGDILVRKDFLQNQREVKKFFGIKPPVKRVDEVIEFYNIRDISYDPEMRRLPDGFEELKYIKDERVIVPYPDTINYTDYKVFNKSNKEIWVPQLYDDAFNPVEDFNVKHKRHTITSFLQNLIEDYEIHVKEIYFDSSLIYNGKVNEVGFFDNGFVRLEKDGKEKIIEIGDKVMEFGKFTNNYKVRFYHTKKRDAPEFN